MLAHRREDWEVGVPDPHSTTAVQRRSNYPVAIFCPKAQRDIFMPNNTAADRNTRAIAWLRIAVGILFLLFGEYKVFGTHFVFGGGFQSWIELFLKEHSAYPFTVPILRGLVLRHAVPIALVVAYGELAIGLSLVFGVLVRAASVCGFFYMLALLFASNFPGPDVALWEYFGAALNHLVLAFCFAAFLLGDPTRVLSILPHVRRIAHRGDSGRM